MVAIHREAPHLCQALLQGNRDLGDTRKEHTTLAVHDGETAVSTEGLKVASPGKLDGPILFDRAGGGFCQGGDW